MELNANIRHEDGMYWAEVEELPGCFASGAVVDQRRQLGQRGVLDTSGCRGTSMARVCGGGDVPPRQSCLGRPPGALLDLAHDLHGEIDGIGGPAGDGDRRVHVDRVVRAGARAAPTPRVQSRV